MKELYLVKAINKLRPGAEFSFIETDYSTIKWDVLDGEIPTNAEIDAAIEEVKAEEVAEAANKEAIKQSVMDKLGLSPEQSILDRLGITSEEAKLIAG